MRHVPVVIVTGAAKGIGASIAAVFARNGFAVALVDVDREGLDAVRHQLEKNKSDTLAIPGDVQDLAFLQEIITQTVKKWGRIDVLVNNAAWRTRETLRTISSETWDKTIRICLTAPAFLTKYAAAVMEEKGIPGVIINISSIQSQLTGGGSPAYTACKGGLESLTYESAVLYGPTGVRVVAISPGNITTALSDDFVNGKADNISDAMNADMIAATPVQRAGFPDEIASLAYWLSSREASFITGTTIVADGGFAHSFNSYALKKLQFPDQF